MKTNIKIFYNKFKISYILDSIYIIKINIKIFYNKFRV